MCGVTTETRIRHAVTDCALDFGKHAASGSWMLRGSDATLDICIGLCSACSKCHYLSFARTDCSWYETCNLHQILRPTGVRESIAQTYVTVQLRGAARGGARGIY